jgi:uncharacterized GH25 family protein
VKTFPFGIAVIGMLAAGTILAHYTWVAPVEAPMEIGKTSTVRISHGHKFPNSEEPINAGQVELFVLSPSGARVKLDPAALATVVTAKYAAKEAGLHRIVMLQDRGVASRTPKGVQQGGRDKHPDAIQAYRTFRSAVAYATTAKSAVAGAQPAGLEFELAGQYSNGAWQLQLMKQGKPVPDVPIEVFMAGAAEASAAGRTGPNGSLTYRPPAGAKGPAMFSAEVKQAPPAGAKYDAVNYSTSLYVSW